MSKLKVDRGRITHGESKRVSLMALKLQRAQKEADIETAESILNEMDVIVGKMVVEVPDGWLPDGIHIGDAGWMDHLSQVNYEAIMAAGQAAAPGEKKD